LQAMISNHMRRCRAFASIVLRVVRKLCRRGDSGRSHSLACGLQMLRA
jgi:hypothetical protein